MTEVEIEKAIKKEKAKLNKVYKNVDDDKYHTVEQLMNNAAFLSVQLLNLQEMINANGAIETYDNGGGQTGTRMSPAVVSYNKLLTNYNTVVKTLLAVNPDAQKADDGFADFLKQ